MKVVILAGGMGTRISEESHLKPKPMIEIGGKPLLWHIMKLYSSHGLYDFIVCCGYKGVVIKEYFSNYALHTSDVTFDFCDGGRMDTHHKGTEPWKVTLIDTGLHTATAGRIRRAGRYLDDDIFLLTYGDGLCDVPVHDVIAFHRGSKAKLTVTAVRPEGRYGALDMAENGMVRQFVEKPRGDGTWINGGYMVADRSVVDYIAGDDTDLESEVLPRLAREGSLAAYRHTGYWQSMDTLREKNRLEALWEKGKAPWKIWKDEFRSQIK